MIEKTTVMVFLGAAFLVSGCAPASLSREVAIYKESQKGNPQGCVDMATSAIDEYKSAARLPHEKSLARLQATRELLGIYATRMFCYQKLGKHELEDADRKECLQLVNRIAAEAKDSISPNKPDESYIVNATVQWAMQYRQLCRGGTELEDSRTDLEERLKLATHQVEAAMAASGDSPMAEIQAQQAYGQRAAILKKLGRLEEAKADEESAIAVATKGVSRARMQVEAAKRPSMTAAGGIRDTGEVYLAAAYATRAELKQKFGRFKEAVPDLEAELQIKAQLCAEHGGLIKRFCEDAANKTEALAILKKKVAGDAAGSPKP